MDFKLRIERYEALLEEKKNLPKQYAVPSPEGVDDFLMWECNYIKSLPKDKIPSKIKLLAQSKRYSPIVSFKRLEDNEIDYSKRPVRINKREVYRLYADKIPLFNLHSIYGIPLVAVRALVEEQALNCEVFSACAPEIDSKTGELKARLCLTVNKSELLQLENERKELKELREYTEKYMEKRRLERWEKEREIYERIEHEKEAITRAITKRILRPIKETFGDSAEFFHFLLSVAENGLLSAPTLLKEKATRIAELEAQLAAAEEAAKRKEVQAVAEPDTTVKAAKWENSVSAAFDLWNEIFQGNKNSWTRDEFTTALAEKYPDYHTKVLALAWNRLPEKYKQGPGRPKTCENPKNP